MNRDARFRTALPEDSEHFSRLMLLSVPRLLPAVYGANPTRIVKSLFNHKFNLYSYEHSRFVEINGRIAGMVLSYDWKVQRQETLRTALLLLKYMKVQFVNRLPVLLKLNAVTGSVGVDEYYISNIAVYPEYRGLGLARGLLMQVEDEARRAGAKRVVLDFEADNQGAIELYNKTGYIPVREPRTTIMCGETFTFCRVSKAISNTPQPM